MREKIKSFTDLEAWQVSHRLVVEMFAVCEGLPQYDTLRKQIERFALSITSNIAEGFGRHSIADKRHFYVIARGSAYEVQNQLLVARDTKKVTETTFQSLADLSIPALRLLHGLIRSLDKLAAGSPPPTLSS